MLVKKNILQSIFIFLDIKSILRFSQTNKYYNKMVNVLKPILASYLRRDYIYACWYDDPSIITEEFISLNQGLSPVRPGAITVKAAIMNNISGLKTYEQIEIYICNYLCGNFTGTPEVISSEIIDLLLRKIIVYKHRYILFIGCILEYSKKPHYIQVFFNSIYDYFEKNPLTLNLFKSDYIAYSIMNRNYDILDYIYLEEADFITIMRQAVIYGRIDIFILISQRCPNKEIDKMFNHTTSDKMLNQIYKQRERSQYEWRKILKYLKTRSCKNTSAINFLTKKYGNIL